MPEQMRFCDQCGPDPTARVSRAVGSWSTLFAIHHYFLDLKVNNSQKCHLWDFEARISCHLGSEGVNTKLVEANNSTTV